MPKIGLGKFEPDFFPNLKSESEPQIPKKNLTNLHRKAERSLFSGLENPTEM